MVRTVPEISRRAALGGSALLFPGIARADTTPAAAFQALEKSNGARIGVAALDTGSGKTVFHRQNERFLLCSTFKLSLAAAILAKVDKGGESLDRRVRYGKSVPIGHSPATTENITRGMTVAELCRAAIIYSDNGAANLLLASIGGPAAMTGYWRGIGDRLTRLDNNEMKLNIPDGVRNTTTPAAMMADLKTLLLGEALLPGSRARLLGWMRENTTGANRLRAGLPPDWQMGDKTGTGLDRYGLVNDIAIVFPPMRKPILVAAYTERGNEKALAAVGKILAVAFA
jgi:beta-lactamase class A